MRLLRRRPGSKLAGRAQASCLRPFGKSAMASSSPASCPPNKSFKPTPHRGVNSVLYATLHAVAASLWVGLTPALGPMTKILPWLPLFGPMLAALVAIIGLGITHSLTSKRDLNSEKRKIRINFMIEAYRKLENGSCRGQNQHNYSHDFHSAIADIQLLGSPGQVEIARKIASALGSGSGALITINELLNALRTELRQELNLPSVGSELVILREPGEITRPSNGP
jgi:hypothetical protein